MSVALDAGASDERRTFHASLREAVVAVDSERHHHAVGRQEVLRSDRQMITAATWRLAADWLQRRHGGPSMEKVEVDGRQLAYRASGSGPPLVLLHGGLVDSRVWSREIDDFADEFRVVAWDAPGCGQSSDPPSDATLDDYADSVAGLIEALELGPAHILGHSFGGGLALAVYKRHARLVRSMILVSAYAGWAGSLPAEEVDQRRQRAERNARRPPREWVDEFLSTVFDETTPRHLVEETRNIMLDARPEGMLPMLNAFAEADLTDVLGTLRVPTLLLYGDKDQRSPRPVAESLSASIPTSRLVFVGGAGHDVNIEAPEAFDNEVRSFLRSVARRP